MPVYNTDPAQLERAIQSVISQLYPYWELCISDDASTNPAVRPILETFAKTDSRIKVAYRDTNGHIAVNSNEALRLATGDYIGMLDHDDELAEQALFWFVNEIQKCPDVAIIYCDEDKLDDNGTRREPLFKPDWNPALIMAQNYVCHMTLYRKNLLERVGGFRVGFEGESRPRSFASLRRAGRCQRKSAIFRASFITGARAHPRRHQKPGVKRSRIRGRRAPELFNSIWIVAGSRRRFGR